MLLDRQTSGFGFSAVLRKGADWQRGNSGVEAAHADMPYIVFLIPVRVFLELTESMGAKLWT